MIYCSFFLGGGVTFNLGVASCSSLIVVQDCGDHAVEKHDITTSFIVSMGLLNIIIKACDSM